MVCIYCSGSTQVTNSRPQKRTQGVWRRRQCSRCGATYTTLEQPDLNASLRVESLDGKQLTPFSRAKLFASIYECLKHLPDPAQVADELTNTVTATLLNTKSAVLSRETIASNTTAVLSRFNKLAGDQYAAMRKKA
jgi:transcriptional repressor NrdR